MCKDPSQDSAQIDGALYGDTMLVSILSGWAPGGGGGGTSL